ncbi:MAG: hypothetical protein AAGI03_15910 [Pseudomonadota bacterium]
MIDFASGILVATAAAGLLVMLAVTGYFVAEIVKDRQAARDGKLAFRRIVREVVSKRS